MKADKDHTSELTAWRKSHWDELEATLKVFKSIRDDPEATNKDRIEAAKGVGRLLAVLSPEKVSANSEEKDSAGTSRRKIPELSPALKARLASVLNNGT